MARATCGFAFSFSAWVHAGQRRSNQAGANPVGRTRPRRRAVRRLRSVPRPNCPGPVSRQRSLQKGKSASRSESVGLRQIGHWCFMDDPRDCVVAAHLASATPDGSQASTRSAAPVEIVRAGATRDPCNHGQCFTHLDHAANQIVIVRLGNLNGDHVAGNRRAPARRRLEIVQIYFAVNFRRHAFEARFPDQFGILRRPFHQGVSF